jgi:hypothetical protein
MEITFLYIPSILLEISSELQRFDRRVGLICRGSNLSDY